MVASDSFAEFLREQLAPLGHLTMRRMFGKTGVFCDGVMLAMVTDNTLYFRVDDDNRAAFKEADASPPLNYRKQGAPWTSPFGARRSGCSTNPMSWSNGRGWRWRRRAASPRRTSRPLEEDTNHDRLFRTAGVTPALRHRGGRPRRPRSGGWL